MTEQRWRVPLPHGAEPPLRVFVSGVAQTEGVDYDIEGRDLMFRKPLVKEELGFFRWAAMFLALFGSYGRNDTVDVQYTIGGKTTVASGLEFFPPDGTLPGQ
jgi:predicted metalloprotease with PDZ domain